MNRLEAIAYIKKRTDKEERLLLSKALDQYQKEPKGYTNFIALCQANLILNFCKRFQLPYQIRRVNPLCKKIIVDFGNNPQSISIYKIQKENHPFEHRDILGTLFSLGLASDRIGDIFVEKDVVYFTVMKSVDPIIEQDLRTIKRQPISVKKVDEIILNETHRVPIQLVITSNRLDNIVSKLMKKNRTSAQEWIRLGNVFVNEKVCSDIHKELIEQDVLSIRHCGKFSFQKITHYTKNGKGVYQFEQYR